MSSSVASAICTSSSLALIDLPEPDTPRRKLLPFSSFRAVGHDHVLADCVLPVINTARLQNFLRAERDQHGGALGGQGAQGLDAAQTVGQHRVETVFLLPAQRRKLAQVLASHRLQRLGVAVELLLAVRHVDEGDEPNIMRWSRVVRSSSISLVSLRWSSMS